MGHAIQQSRCTGQILAFPAERADRSDNHRQETGMKRFIVRINTRLAEVRDAHDHGGVAAEYGVLLAGIVAVVAVAAAALGGRIDGIFDSILP